MPAEGALRARERGASAVEFALIVVPLCYLAVAILNYGLLLSFRQVVSQSAAEGARAGAVTAPGGDVTTNAVDAVSEALGHGLVCAPPSIDRGSTPVGTCTVGVGPCANAPATCISVAVDVDYSVAAVGPTISLVPMPHHLRYAAVAEVGQ